MSVAAEAPGLKIAVAGVERIVERRRWLCRFLDEHPVIPGAAGELVGLLLRFRCVRGCCAYRSPERVLRALMVLPHHPADFASLQIIRMLCSETVRGYSASWVWKRTRYRFLASG